MTFSDEKIFRARPGGLVRCWVQKGANKYSAKYVTPVQQKHIGLMVWAAMDGKGNICLRRCPPKVNAVAYQDILATALTFIKKRCGQTYFLLPRFHLHRSSTRTFQQDGAPVHKARSTSAWLRRKGVRVFNGDQWPPSSPDTNPIEHIWPLVGRMMAGKVFTNRETLWVALQAAFAAIKPEQVLRLYTSMPDRLAALAKSKGGHTRY